MVIAATSWNFVDRSTGKLKEDIPPEWLSLGSEDMKILKAAVEKAIYFERVGAVWHGVSRREPKTYKILVKLQRLACLKRVGYHYFPTIHALRLYFKSRDLEAQLVAKPELRQGLLVEVAA